MRGFEGVGVVVGPCGCLGLRCMGMAMGAVVDEIDYGGWGHTRG